MKKVFFTLALGAALFLTASSYTNAGTKKSPTANAPQENTCCGGGGCVEGSCH